MEKLIESELMADVVQRFRRAVTTQNKIGQLAKISLNDCSYLDAVMTKYSRYEHSQPDELPVPLPEPTEVANDLSELSQWLTEFTSRSVPVA